MNVLTSDPITANGNVSSGSQWGVVCTSGLMEEDSHNNSLCYYYMPPGQ